MSAIASLSDNASPAEPTAPPERKSRILVVDDLHDNRTLLRRRLVTRGFEVVEAEDGRQALDRIEAEGFDLVLLDVMMPGMSGLEVLEEIRKVHVSEALPVIMVTAKSFSEDVVAALERGADDYVTKPVDFAVALARINAQIARKRAHDERAAAIADQALRLRQVQDQVGVEIEEKLRSEAAAAFLASHDALTGLTNRTRFAGDCDRILATLTDADTVSVLFIDLDRFKAVNDTLGHAVGDELLKQVAIRLCAGLAPEDRAARFGGDEFMLLRRHRRGTDDALRLAEEVVAALVEPFEIGGRALTIGASIGVATSAQGHATTEGLVSDADTAMYAAKKAGGNAIRAFDADLAEAARQRKQLEIALQDALKNDELSLVYQPIFDIATGDMVAAEALLRWNHPSRGCVSPAEFIPIAEETGMIIPVGEWVLRQACRQCAAWPGNVRIAVNLSPLQIERGNIVAAVINVLGETGLPPDRLELEVTEGLFLAQSPRDIATLNQLREIGVRIALDDFGTGYSSLSYLRGFSFNKIKIDKSFIKSIETNEGSRKIIASIASLAEELGIVTTAEGVENEMQMNYVAANGMTQVQGFLIGKPMDNDHLPFARPIAASDSAGGR